MTYGMSLSHIHLVAIYNVLSSSECKRFNSLPLILSVPASGLPQSSNPISGKRNERASDEHYTLCWVTHASVAG